MVPGLGVEPRRARGPRDSKATGCLFPCPRSPRRVVESEDYVAVGTPVARRPPHRSGRAALPHPAPTLGDDAEPREKIPGGLTYLLERAGRACPARCPERVALVQVPLGRPPSLHRLRGRSPGFVRRLPRYYGAVRLPTSVHHRRASWNFPVRPAISRATGGHGICRV